VSVVSTLLRRSAVPLVVPVLVVFGVLAALAQPSTWVGDWATASAHLGSAIAVLAPLVAGVAAWTAGSIRPRGFRTLAQAMPRSPLATCVIVVAGAATAGLIGYGAAAIAIALKMQGGGTPWWPVVGLPMLGIVVCAAVGFAVGSFLRRSIAAPVTVALTYAWMVFPEQWLPAWRSMLSPIPFDCCGPNTVLNRPVVLGELGWLFAVLAAAVFAVAIAPRAVGSGDRVQILRLPLFAPAIVVLAGGIGGLVHVGGRLTVLAPPQRSQACASADGFRVCLFPQHRYQLAGTLKGAVEAEEQLPGLMPREIFEYGLALPRGPVPAVVQLPGGVTDPSVLAATVADGLVPPTPHCAKVDAGARYPAAAGIPTMELWLGQHFSMLGASNPFADMASGGMAPPDPDLNALLAASPAAQSRWISQERTALEHCGVPTPPLP
jgi:hypothetical protein